jgi:hypothetical protein
MSTRLSQHHCPAARSSALADERRNHHRHPYPAIARVAGYSVSESTKPAAMREVMCRDISAEGFSFYLNERIDNEFIVAEFAGRPTPVRMLARIINQIPATLLTLFDEQASHPGEFVVRCEFLEHLG